MGYYTYYTLNVDGYKKRRLTEEEVSAIDAEIELMDVFAGGNCYDGYFSEDLKWYEHDNDMMLLSSRIPDVLFSLHGEGESQEDLWNAYYLNGKMLYCPADICYPPFDESQLGSAIVDSGERYFYQTKESPPRTKPEEIVVDANALL